MKRLKFFSSGRELVEINSLHLSIHWLTYQFTFGYWCHSNDDLLCKLMASYIVEKVSK